MNYEILSTSHFVDFETVAVGLLKHYPSSDPNDFLFCQFQAVKSPKGLHVQVLAFEVGTLPNSRIVIFLEGNGTQVRVEGRADKRFFGANGMEPKWLTGGDNQGEFWGISFLIPDGLINDITCDDIIIGNVYKYKGDTLDCSLFSQDKGELHILK